ncbi:MAG: TIGR03915 family putative DNA repair protein [Bacillota bacterium]
MGEQFAQRTTSHAQRTTSLTYQYDGSFEGLLCCVFQSYAMKELPIDIIPPEAEALSLFPVKEIPTDLEKANRVLNSIPVKMGPEALEFVQHAFLTCLEQKELHILLFLRLGYQHGPSVMDMLANDVVDKLFKAVTHLKRESHLLCGFVRFSVFNNALAAEIEPKNYVLPLLTKHFTERYPDECFLIHDKTHGMALIYEPYRSAIIPIIDLELPDPDQEELTFRELWQQFYKTIAIEARYNPRLRMNHMPKRYWKYLTEFGQARTAPVKNAPQERLFIAQKEAPRSSSRASLPRPMP